MILALSNHKNKNVSITVKTISGGKCHNFDIIFLYFVSHLITKRSKKMNEPVCPLDKYRREFGSTPWSTPQHTSRATWTQEPREWPRELDSLSARHTPPADDWTLPCRDSGPPQRPSCEQLKTSSFCQSEGWLTCKTNRKINHLNQIYLLVTTLCVKLLCKWSFF